MDVNLGDADSTREIPAGSSVVQLICRSYAMVLTYDDIANFLRSTGVVPGFIVVDPEHRNEAFAAVAMIAMRDMDLSHDRLNVHGGACALGHPIGASGARVLATLLSALETQGARRGMASLCIGGGEATAMAVELM